MVTWGAERILSAEEGQEIQDEDIDALLARGEEQAEELNKRLKDNCQQNLLSFSLFQDKSLYSFEGMDYSGTPTEFLKVFSFSLLPFLRCCSFCHPFFFNNRSKG